MAAIPAQLYLVMKTEMSINCKQYNDKSIIKFNETTRTLNFTAKVKESVVQQLMPEPNF